MPLTFWGDEDEDILNTRGHFIFFLFNYRWYQIVFTPKEKTKLFYKKFYIHTKGRRRKSRWSGWLAKSSLDPEAKPSKLTLWWLPVCCRPEWWNGRVCVEWSPDTTHSLQDTWMWGSVALNASVNTVSVTLLFKMGQNTSDCNSCALGKTINYCRNSSDENNLWLCWSNVVVQVHDDRKKK